MKRFFATFGVIALLAFAIQHTIPLVFLAAAQNMPAPAAPPLAATVMPALPVQPEAPAPVAAATQNTVTTTGPVSSNTTISVGTIGGQVLTWAVAGFGSLAASVFTAWGIRLFKLAGIQITDAARDRFKQIVLNGINAGAAAEAKNWAGKDQVEIKDAIVQHAVVYAQTHGADTIKALGLDPQSGAAVQAIRANIETAIADPAVPTPAVLDPAAAPKPPA